VTNLIADKILLYVIVFALGISIGSFLNVVIYRVPRKQSIIRPPSHCPICGHRLAWYDLIPVFSYIFQKGRCRYCGAKISYKYPLVELITGLSFIAIFAKFGLSVKSAEYMAFASFLIAGGFMDLFDGVVNDWLVILGIATGLSFSVYFNTFFDNLLGMAVAFAFFALIIFLTHGNGMGEGDATFGALIGSFLGIKLTILTILFAFILGAIIGVILIYVFHRKKEDAVPFVPFMALSAFMMLFIGNPIISFYMKLFH